ncbi:MAG TPA: N-6 DNA methylase, partial [Acinetobacter sp.]|nr:N-6 DNA methylase [Acinetobacter sp.]
MHINNNKRAFNQLLFEANLLLKKEGVLENKKRFFEFAPLLILKLMSESVEMPYSRQSMRIKQKYNWKHFAKQEPQEMLQVLNRVFLPGLVKAYNRHTQFFQKKSSIKNPDTLKKLVDRLSILNLLALNSDILGDAFEYFLHQEGARYKQGLGIYFTPRHVIKLLLDLIPLKPNDKIYDPACGSGGFLTEAFKILKKRSKTSSQYLNKKVIFGREISDSIKIAKMNLILLGADPSTLSQIDTLKTPVHNKFSVILANFPFSQKTDFGSLYGSQSKDANPLFLKHIMDALIMGGTAGVIVPDRLLFSESLEYIKVRKNLLETCNLLAVVQLHDFVFMPYTKQPTSILIFKTVLTNIK